MKTFNAISDEKWMKKHPQFQMFSNFGFDRDTVYVTKNWLEKHTELPASIDLNENEIYETSLTITGFHNVEAGIYSIEVENGKVQHGDTNKHFQVLIDGQWIKIRPFDHKGYYAKAKALGY
jgi:hypothetical protein